MGVLIWCGGEDLSFDGTVTVDTASGHFRSAYCRCGLYQPAQGAITYGNPFSGGAVISAWVSVQLWWGANYFPERMIFGVATSGSGKGIFIGSANGNNAKVALAKYDGSTVTDLATESGASLGTGVQHRFDIQITGPMTAATINVYLDSASGALMTYTGDISAILTSFNCVALGGPWSSTIVAASEIIVDQDDTRGIPFLLTRAPTGPGTTDAWPTGDYTGVNEVSISDAYPNQTDTVAQDQQFALTAMPSGSYGIRAVLTAVRAVKSTGSPTATEIALGYNNAGTVTVGPAQPLSTSFQTIEQLDQAPFTLYDMGSLQTDLRSA